VLGTILGVGPGVTLYFDFETGRGVGSGPSLISAVVLAVALGAVGATVAAWISMLVVQRRFGVSGK